MISSVQDFTEVYQEHLPTVWRFVSSRVPDFHEAQDVTSEVFTQAWRSWKRFDPARGSAVAWLCGIAHHTVADWWRQQARRGGRRAAELAHEAWCQCNDLPGGERGEEPEVIVLRTEAAVELRRALSTLTERERDALALRFAARLRVAEIGKILNLSVGATKMMVYRALMKLRGSLASESTTLAADERMASSLDELIDDVVARRRPEIADPVLGQLVHFMAVVHQRPVPPELWDRVRHCMTCVQVDSDAAKGGAGSPSRFSLARFGILSIPGLTKAATAPACVACAGYTALAGPLTAVGLMGPVVLLHWSLWVLAPLNIVLLWQSSRRHRQVIGLVVAGVGVALILLHLAMHFINPWSLAFIASDIIGLHGSQLYTTVERIESAGIAAIWLGLALLTAGLVIDWWAQRRKVVTVGVRHSS